MIRIKSIFQSKRLVAATALALIGAPLLPVPAQAANFTVTYSTAGSTSGSAPSTATVAESTTYTTASSTTLAKTGFVFNGWNTAENATGTPYTAGATFTMPAANVTLYPVWRGTITYNANGGLGTPTVSTQVFNLGTDASLTTVGTLTRTGYTFLGWKSSATASSYTAPGGSFATSGLTAGPTLYATWGRTFSFNINGATVGSTPSSQTWVELGSGIDLSGVGSDLKRRGYDFAGWATGVGGAAITGLFTPTLNSQVLYAAWKAQETKSSFNIYVSPKKYALTPEIKIILDDFASKFEKTALFPKTSIKIFVGSTRHSSVSASLGKKRINAVTNYLKGRGVTAKFLWSNDVRSRGKAADKANNRVRIISNWVN
jgi:uncharacterized repeat protein (TIGR02543 family)